jgi:Ca2+:H+ antiporter
MLVCVSLYGTFLAIQTVRHTGYFSEDSAGDDQGHAGLHVRSVPYHTAMLLAYLIPVVLLAKKLAIPIDYAIEGFGLPTALGGFIVAALVLTPEAMGAVKAALANHLQRSVNIFLGSVLATIGLTVPAVLAISLATGNTIELGLQNADLVMLVTTLGVSVLTFSAARTNLLQGAVHLILFLAYLMLIFAP